MLQDYLNRRSLARCGVSFRAEELSCIEAEYLSFISNEHARLDNEQERKNAKKAIARRR